MFSEKTHNLLRKAAILCGAASFALGIFTASVDLGKFGVIVAALLGAASGFISYIADHDSGVYFDTRDIVDKVVPDTEEL